VRLPGKTLFYSRDVPPSTAPHAVELGRVLSQVRSSDVALVSPSPPGRYEALERSGGLVPPGSTRLSSPVRALPLAPDALRPPDPAASAVRQRFDRGRRVLALTRALRSLLVAESCRALVIASAEADDWRAGRLAARSLRLPCLIWTLPAEERTPATPATGLTRRLARRLARPPGVFSPRAGDSAADAAAALVDALSGAGVRS
jgi:hypothetical protein